MFGNHLKFPDKQRNDNNNVVSLDDYRKSNVISLAEYRSKKAKAKTQRDSSHRVEAIAA